MADINYHQNQIVPIVFHISALHCHWSLAESSRSANSVAQNHVFMAAIRFMSLSKQIKHFRAVCFWKKSSQSCEMEINKTYSDGNVGEK